MLIKNYRKNHKNKKNVRYKPMDKHFPNLTDKKMLKIMDVYENVYKRHVNLQSKINITFASENIKNLLDNVNIVSGLIQRELNNLKNIYDETVYRDFINQTGPFKKLLFAYKKYLQELEFALLDEKSPVLQNQENQR